MLATPPRLDHAPFYDAVSKGEFPAAHDFMQRRYIAPFRYGNPLRVIPIFRGVSSQQWDAIQAAGRRGGTAAPSPARLALRPDIASGSLERPTALFGEPSPHHHDVDDLPEDQAADMFRTIISCRTDEYGRVAGEVRITCWRTGGDGRPAAASRRASWSDHDPIDLPASATGHHAISGAPGRTAGRVKQDDLPDATGLRQITGEGPVRDGIRDMDELILIS